ncbi:MAG: hypothetical protein H2043_06385 [Rhizobiales bacterium]|nr:hypothetical protein [Hyphomicrobiales bacterium]
MTQATTWKMPSAAPATPTEVATRANDSFDSLLTWHSGSARPSYAVAGTVWQDTSTAGFVRVYFYDGTADILICEIDTTNDRVDRAPQPLVDVAAAATTNLGAAKTENQRVTAGASTITAFGTIRAGTFRRLYFATDVSITHNATSMITQTSADLVVKVGDQIDAVSLGSGNWRILSHTRAVPTLSRSFESAEQTITSAGALTIAHGLGVEPFVFTGYLVCKSAEAGYSINDRVLVPLSYNTDSGFPSSGMSLVPDATNLNIRFGASSSTFSVVHKTTGVRTSLTNSNWRLVVRALA